MVKSKIVLTKAIMLWEVTIQLDKNIDKRGLYRSTENIGKNQWIFSLFSETSRARMS